MSIKLPELAAVAACLYWILPYLVTKKSSIDQQVASEIIRIIWGILMISAVSLPPLLARHKQKKVTHDAG